MFWNVHLACYQILGYNNINIGSQDESNGESFGGQLFELTVRGREFFMD